MKRFLGAAKLSASSSTHSLSVHDEPQALDDAMAAVSYILNDDVDTAEKELNKGNSPFHKLGLGVVGFLRATLGFEQEVMKQASERLADSETAAYDHQRRAEKDAYQSKIYPPGSEYALCLAESQLMSAVVAVLNESLSESIKGFYKLRKAYVTLQEIANAEERFMKTRSSASLGSARNSIGSTPSSVPASSAPSVAQMDSASLAGQTLVGKDDEDDEDDMDFVDADEDVAATATPTHYQGHLDSAELATKIQDMSLKSGTSAQTSAEATRQEDDEFKEHITHPIDIFIHSGLSLCFGILQLMLSLIPPAFSKLLYIVGFKGDRQAGIKMLWRATKYDNINGAMAGLVTLGFYNVTVGFCDILYHDAYPKERLQMLLTEMRSKYPQSRLWRLEEARMLASEQKLEEAVEMTGTGEKGPLKEVEALQYFEKSLNCMYLHRYDDCATYFLKCVELNNWSHGLYYYIAGACHVELYRQNKSTDPVKAEKHASRATTLLRTVPSQAGKKRFMARQLPFDAFVVRKLSKWEERAKALSIPFIDAVGVAPVEEIIYFWAGFKRMRPEHLQHSLQVLDWSEKEGVARGDVDELAVLNLLRATVTARLGGSTHMGYAKAILEKEVLTHEWAEFKGGFKDNWALPVAHYEMAVIRWIECGGEKASKQDLEEVSRWLEKAARWESYDLDARIGLKVTTARETLKKCGVTSGGG